MLKEIRQASARISDKLICHRRYLHENPETCFNTKNTCKYIKQALDSIGVECSFFATNAVAGIIRGCTGGKTILLRCDTDALAIREQTDLEYSSKNENMHACGHDMHASMLLGAAEILQSMKDELCGNVRLLFQPAEEILKGAKDAIDNGIASGVDMAMTLHVIPASQYNTGSVILSYDSPAAPSADFFTIRIYGKGCHSSSPSLGISPIECTCTLVNSLGHIRTHEIGIHEKALLTIGKIQCGDSANIIPENAEISGTLRCFDEDTRAFYKRRLNEMTQSICKCYRCESNIEFTSECPCLINNRQLLEKTKSNMTQLLGKDMVFEMKNSKSNLQGSEDFAYFSNIVPSISLGIAAGKSEDGYNIPLHSPKVTFDETALAYGAEVFSYNAIMLLRNMP